MLNFQTFCCNLKIGGLGAKLCVFFYYFYFEKNYGLLKTKSPCFLLNKKINFHKTKRNRKWKIPHTVLGKWSLCFSWYKNWDLKVKLWWFGARERKKRVYFAQRKFFQHFCSISMYSVLNKLQNIYFFISKNITSYTFVACL